MSTYTALHVQTTQVDSVRELCQRWLSGAHGVTSIEVKEGAFPQKAFTKIFDEKPPTTLAIGTAPPGWVTIQYNSFHPMEELARQLSAALQAQVIGVSSQSVSSAYVLTVYQAGERRRQLAWTDGVWAVNEGNPLPFETSPLGTNISEPGEEPYYVFEEEEVAAYCRALGLPLWEAEPPTWLTLALPSRSWWPFRR